MAILNVGKSSNINVLDQFTAGADSPTVTSRQNATYFDFPAPVIRYSLVAVSPADIEVSVEDALQFDGFVLPSLPP